VLYYIKIEINTETDMEDKKRQSGGKFEEDQHRVSKAEGQRDPGRVVTKVTGSPDQAEGDRETIEQDLEQNTGSRD
jgi:hypothetical protein